MNFELRKRTSAIPKIVACVGSGTIGSSWALLFALKGARVVAYDIHEEATDKSASNIENMLNTMAHHKLIKKSDSHRALARIEFTTNLDDVAASDYLQESAIERIDTKIALLERLEKIVSRDVIIASSTSGLSMTEMQRGMRYPDRAVIAHPFNPPHLVPLVEVVRGKRTSERAISAVVSVMEALGKVPVRVNKQLPGFAANRLQTAVLRESLAMLVEGVVDADGLEKIMNSGLGLRWSFMGPLITAHLAGGSGGLEYYLKHFGPLTKSICETLSSWTVIPKRAEKQALVQTRDIIPSRSYDEMVEWRDENLIGILKQRGFLRVSS